MKVENGDRVYIPNEKKPYKVRCRNNRYIICTKPCNLHHAIKYFIVDLEEKRRGADDKVFSDGYETDNECLERLDELRSGFIKVSTRNSVSLDIDIQ